VVIPFPIGQHSIASIRPAALRDHDAISFGVVQLNFSRGAHGGFNAGIAQTSEP